MTTPDSRTLPDPTLKWLFFSFRGRIARQSFILAVLFQCIIFGLSVYQAVAAENQPDRLALAGFMILAAMAFSFWSILALSVKRLHDLNHPAPLVIMLFFPGVNWLLLLYLMARPSYAETNEHGPPPQGI